MKIFLTFLFLFSHICNPQPTAKYSQFSLLSEDMLKKVNHWIVEFDLRFTAVLSSVKFH